MNESFKSLSLSEHYDTAKNDVLHGFFVPVLSKSVLYKRISAFFSVGALKAYSEGIEEIVKSNGKIKFIFSHEIDQDTYNRIREGYNQRKSLENEISTFSKNDLSDDFQIANLAYLIAHKYCDVKIAYILKEGMPAAIAHYKTGIFIDLEGNMIRMSGSINESYNGLMLNGESFDVALSYDTANEKDVKRCFDSNQNFDEIWNSEEENIVVVDGADLLERKLQEFDKGKLFSSESDFFNGNVVFDLEDNEHGRFFVVKDFSEKRLASYSKLKMKLDFAHFKHVNNVYSIELEKINLPIIKRLINAAKDDSKSYSYIETVRLKSYVDSLQMSIYKRVKLGTALKQKELPEVLKQPFDDFQKSLSALFMVNHKLTKAQALAAFFAVTMKSSANYSVPGTGKTTMAYAAFAYLKQKGEIDNAVIIGPLSSFKAWKKEYIACFGKKPNLLNCKDDSIHDLDYELINCSKKYELFLFNYESLEHYGPILAKRIITNRTMLIFDEVHKIKNYSGTRALAALKLINTPVYKMILSGTPIPNSYTDLYNQFQILFTQEHPFEYSVSYLAGLDDIQGRVLQNEYFPFFIRITKKDLAINPADPNDIETLRVPASAKEESLISLLYKKYHDNKLLLIIRLIQAQSNPKLLLESDIENVFDSDEDDFDSSNSDFPYHDFTNIADDERQLVTEIGDSSKYKKTVSFIEQFSKSGKKIIVWCLFRNTIDKLRNDLLSLNIKTISIYGIDSLDIRENKIDSFLNDEGVQVLITNPNTMAESVSLHTVCHDAIYLEFGYNLTYLLQSKDRIHRYGIAPDQKTHYYFSIMESNDPITKSIDDVILEKLNSKEKRMISTIEDNYLDIENSSSWKDDVESILESCRMK
jgi:superfamily II DNA or RNA helicase